MFVFQTFPTNTIISITFLPSIYLQIPIIIEAILQNLYFKIHGDICHFCILARFLGP